MSRLRKLWLSLLGLSLFALLWHGVVRGSQPLPVHRVVLGFAAGPGPGGAVAVVLDARGHVTMRESVPIGPAAHDATVAHLRLWLGALQPTLAGLPPGPAGEELRALLLAAQRDFGGALEVREVPLPTGPGDQPARTDAEALRRAARLQADSTLRPSWLPTPWDAALALCEMVRSGEMARHVVASLFRVACGFCAAVLLGIPFGLVLSTSAPFSAMSNGVIQCLRPISPIAWLPVATLLLGGGDVAAIFLIFLSAFFPIVVSTAAAAGAVDLMYRRSALNFGVRGRQALQRVVLPASLPAILTALRVALGMCWVVVVAAEMLGVESGMGYLILDARNQLRYDRVVAAMVVIGLIGLGLDTLVRHIERGELLRRGLLR